ncbi:MAG: DNA polymerase III subunit alpha [Gammaproteobacteria bacterium]
MAPKFVHLRLHSEYSLVDSVIRIPDLVERLAASNMPAAALTDHGNLFAALKFYEAAQKAGIKSITGADLQMQADNGDGAYACTLLCMNEDGYRNLSALITRSYLEGQQRGVPMLQAGWFEGHTEGLLALSGGRAGDIGRALLGAHRAEAQACLGRWQARFPGRFYLELQRTGREGEEDYLRAAVALAAETGVPLVATNDVRFLRCEDFGAHEARVCIQEGYRLDDARRPRRYSEQQYLRDAAEMLQLFADLPEALANSVVIAERCNCAFHLGKNFMPQYPAPPGTDTETLLREQARAGLTARLAKLGADAALTARYQARLASELEVIVRMGFAGYFLIVADFIRWSKEHAVPVGPGRGSGAGSLVAYALCITMLDPLAHELLFERFLNPERVSMPDFDVDFCMQGRDRVIDYVAQRYGRSQVAQIITFGSMAARAVVRDVGRVLGQPYGRVDQIAKLIPFALDMTLDKALSEEPELKRRYESDDEVRQLIDLAKSLEGLVRNAGKHAGGVVIAPSDLTGFMPLYCEAGGRHPVTQFDKDDVEHVGLVKFDFLGLRTLTIIDWAVRSINATRAVEKLKPIDIDALPPNDPDTYAMLNRCQTTAVFQLESRGMRDLIRRLQLDSFEDIVAVNALFRPGPMNMVDDFIACKRSRHKVDYLHPKLEPILKPTYGVILYQEQVMQIAQVLAGYTLGAADLLRRAIGKKKPEEMAKQRGIFVQGAVARGVEPEGATHIFDLMEKFAGYGFNKSHSAAYALLAYQTAWLKAHYPAAFMAAVLSADMDHTDKIVGLIDDCRSLGLAILPPDINGSVHQFEAADAKSIRYGLGAIKGVGRAAIEGVLEERAQHGAFSSLDDLCRRVDLQKANRRVLEALIRAGALDRLGTNRATLMASLPRTLARADQGTRARAAGQDDLFGLAPRAVKAVDAAPELADWDEEERLRGERETLGLYLTGHPVSRYAPELARVVSASLATLAAESPPASDSERGFGLGARNVTVAGLIVEVRKRGGRVNLTLDDRSGRLEVTLFDEAFNRFRALVVKDKIVVVEGRIAFDEFTGGWRVTAKQMYALDDLRERYVRRLDIEWNPGEAPDFVARLKEMLRPYVGGGCNVWVHYCGVQASVPVCLGELWRVHPTEALTRRLGHWLGAQAMSLHYGAAAASEPKREAVGA